jgi:hypothetical protein
MVEAFQAGAQHAVEVGLVEDVVLVPSEQRLSFESLEREQVLTVGGHVLHPRRHGEQAIEFCLESALLENPGDLGVEVNGAWIRMRFRRAFVHDGAQPGEPAQVRQHRPGRPETHDGNVDDRLWFSGHSGARSSH